MKFPYLDLWFSSQFVQLEAGELDAMKNVFVTTVQNVIRRLVAVYVLLAGKAHLVKKVSCKINP